MILFSGVERTEENEFHYIINVHYKFEWVGERDENTRSHSTIAPVFLGGKPVWSLLTVAEDVLVLFDRTDRYGRAIC